jgi:hypothetical protein
MTVYKCGDGNKFTELEVERGENASEAQASHIANCISQLHHH